MSSTRTPHTTPVMDEAFGLSLALAKNVSNVVSAARCFWSVFSLYPVSYLITSSSSACVRPLRSSFAT